MFKAIWDFLMAILIVAIGLGLLIVAPFIGLIAVVIVSIVILYGVFKADRELRNPKR